LLKKELPTALGGSPCDNSASYLIIMTLWYRVKIGSWSILKMLGHSFCHTTERCEKTHENKTVFKKIYMNCLILWVWFQYRRLSKWKWDTLLVRGKYSWERMIYVIMDTAFWKIRSINHSIQRSPTTARNSLFRISSVYSFCFC